MSEPHKAIQAKTKPDNVSTATSGKGADGEQPAGEKSKPKKKTEQKTRNRPIKLFPKKTSIINESFSVVLNLNMVNSKKRILINLLNGVCNLKQTSITLC